MGGAAAAQYIHRGKTQHQPSEAGRGGSQHVTEIMSAQVHAAKADQQHHDERAEDGPHSPAPGLERDDRKSSQHPIQQRGRHRVTARKTIAVEDQERIRETGTVTMEGNFQEKVQDHATG